MLTFNICINCISFFYFQSTNASVFQQNAQAEEDEESNEEAQENSNDDEPISFVSIHSEIFCFTFRQSYRVNMQI